MHHLFDQLTRTLSGDFMRKDDCCGGNGGEPAIPCCKPDKALRDRQKKALMSGGVLAVNCKSHNSADIGVRVEPQRLNEREAEKLIDLLGEKQ